MKHSIKQFLKLFTLAGFLPVIIFSCRTKQQIPMMTERLFMQYKRVNIVYPPDRVDNGNGAVLSEQVTYNTYPDTESLPETDDTAHLDTNKVYNLSGVTVSSQVRFASVREGHVNVDFVIRVPKELMSDDYRMQLTPELLYNDTIVELEHILLQGKNFLEKQENDYINYDKYLETVVPEDDYTLFIDKAGVDEDMKRRQDLYWKLYTEERQRVTDYWEWTAKVQERYDHFNSYREIKYRNLYHKYQRKGDYAAIVKMTQRQDTLGMSDEYNEKFKKRVKRSPYFKIEREITEPSVPKKYRDLFQAGTRPTEVQNYAVSEQDSVEITEHRYFNDQIVYNELKDSHRESMFKKLVPYPYVDGVRYSVTLNNPQDFTYLYTQEYPVKAGMKKLHVHLKGRIDAIDNSGYTLPQTDTLNYLISSLEELADSTLLMSKNDRYHEGYVLLTERDYKGAMKILGDYNDYNMALSLACQGYNQQAYTLLKRQPQTALVLYLKAIVCSRLSLKQEAVSSLEKACMLDTSMIYRCMRDEEVKKLISEYNLQERLSEIELTSMN